MRSQNLLIALLLAMPACHELDTPETGDELKNMTPTQSAPGTNEALSALRERVIEAGTYTPDPGPIPASDDAKVKLGQALFFDKVVRVIKTLLAQHATTRHLERAMAYPHPSA